MKDHQSQTAVNDKTKTITKRFLRNQTCETCKLRYFGPREKWCPFFVKKPLTNTCENWQENHPEKKPILPTYFLEL